jgi:hypothetical protein
LRGSDAVHVAPCVDWDGPLLSTFRSAVTPSSARPGQRGDLSNGNDSTESAVMLVSARIARERATLDAHDVACRLALRAFIA